MKIAPRAVRRCPSSLSHSTQAGPAAGATGVRSRSPRLRRWLLPLATAVLLAGACDDDLDPARAGGDASGAGTDGPVAAATCSWNPAAAQLTLPQSQVKGVLRGSSRNPSTTCTRQKGTGGPEAVYVLRVTQRT